MTLEELNLLPQAGFVAALAGVFEHAPWVAQRAASARPFDTVAALHEAMMQVLRAAPESEIRAFLNGHPALVGERLAADLTRESREEQRALGMAGTAGAGELGGLNAEYRARFAIPFIICVGRHTSANVLRRLRIRLQRTPADEMAAALEEVGHITRLRLGERLEGAPATSGRLSCHVLDVAAGKPAEAVRVAVLQEGRAIAESLTDSDGRIGGGLLPLGPLRQGHYELAFEAGAYFAQRAVPTFYDTIPVRFIVAASEAHYHIPLLLAPFAYSTYRGS